MGNVHDAVHTGTQKIKYLKKVFIKFSFDVTKMVVTGGFTAKKRNTFTLVVLMCSLLHVLSKAVYK